MNNKFKQKLYNQRYLLLMLLPAFVLVIMFNYIPLSGWYIAFSEYKLGKPMFAGEFVGFKYFIKIFKESSDLVYLIRNTLVINIGSMFLVLFTAMLLSILLTELPFKKFAKNVQSVTFFPYFVSWVIAYAIVSGLFSVNSGAINQFLVSMGVMKKGMNVLGNPQYSWGMILILSIWKFIGYNTIIFLSTISGIPQEEYEAAALDGVTWYQKIRYVTLPNLKPTAAIMLIMDVGAILNTNLEMSFIFTNATNWERMEVLDMYIYKFGLKLLDFPYATAMTVIKCLVNIFLLFFVNWVSRKLFKVSLF